MKTLSVKTQMIVFLCLFAAYLGYADKDSRFLLSAAVAVASAVAAEAAFTYSKVKQLKAASSAVISGLIVGFVCASDQQWWLIILASVAAVSSKFLIRFRGRHLFNPAAFGVCVSMLAFGASTQWKGTYLWYVLVPVGTYFIYKIRKLEILAGYAVVTLLLFGSQALLQRVPLYNIFGYVSYFFIFIMLIEPKTTPIRPLGKALFGAAVAALIFVFTEMGVRFDAELCALLLMNLCVPLLNKRRTQ
jgi:Na+-translocating ferredoxin:NAD+ oxidoreductase RnfD subunit